MKIFSFELIGLQVLWVECPKCKNVAQIIVAPSDENLIAPVQSEIREELEKADMLSILYLPKCDDLHFFCMKCGVSAQHCDKFKRKCLIK